MPKKHFEIACGAPIKQKKHLSVDAILNTLKNANLIKEIHVEGIGTCVYLGLHTNHIETLIPVMKARIFVEELMLRGVKSWMRKLGFVSYNQVAIRTLENNPTVSTTAWDLAGPSYLSPLISFGRDGSTPKPGFVVCDILLNHEVSELGIQPFLQKLNALRSLKNVGKQLCFFLAHSFSEPAFRKLKSLGISPATTAAIFDNETARNLRELTDLLSRVAIQALNPAKIDMLFDSLGKIEGAASRLRGALFEYIIAEAMRSEFAQSVELNRLCKTMNGVKEADVICTNQKELIFIEGKGYSFNNQVTAEEINYWLTEQVPIFRAFALTHPDWKDRKMTFEFWTSGVFSDEAIDKLRKAQSNTIKYQIVYKDFRDVLAKIRVSGNKALTKTFIDHFINHPLAQLEKI
ncbi:hypothetical protein SAMN04488051_1151 [Alkalimonas amylolytica]|uniref:Uncharacterized protein n=2 Tax=Alkalimonas amylolytica TaxID=152573 RepID=A0A1H4FM71_ALKAM|nr:hypothetical protein SAMN04488051_106316 [Alkalimonas amylolytica]SEA97828.1 hypothetical protein SAMN04488051_11136 [Alkalimonas amylolytica]SEB02704.1 hypothetical protein SAMN04488051_1151 [Alkalimonas amylolytica]